MADSVAPLPLPMLPARAADSHKGTYGTVLIVAGSRRYPGAAILAALGAGRAGAGLVQLALAHGIVDNVLPAVPFATLLRCAETEDGGLAASAAPDILAAAARANAVVIGPGIGTGADTGALLATLLPRIAAPVVLDADALNLVASDAGAARAAHVVGSAAEAASAGLPLLTARRAAPSPSPYASMILTPHPGEFARLATAAGWNDADTHPVTATARLAGAARLSRETGAIIVLKGHGTVVTDGARARIESAGNPGMARGGMGDVLSGAIGALLCRVPGALPDAAGAVALAVHAHAVAGDLAAAELGEEAMLPEDVARLLGRALELSGRAP